MRIDTSICYIRTGGAPIKFAQNSKDYLDRGEFDLFANEPPCAKELEERKAQVVHDEITFQLGLDRYIISAVKSGTLKVVTAGMEPLPKKPKRKSKKKSNTVTE